MPINHDLTSSEIAQRIIEMAWEDRTSFDAITRQYVYSEAAVIDLMRQHLSTASFKRWRERVHGRATKHDALRDFSVGRAYAAAHYKINHGRHKK
jgi:uncharacterized protein (TIGR03643 family)